MNDIALNWRHLLVGIMVLPKILLVAQTPKYELLSNGGFEDSTITTNNGLWGAGGGTSSDGVSCSAWTFQTWPAGLTKASSPWATGTNLPVGNTAAYIQHEGAFSQTFEVEHPGTYDLSFVSTTRVSTMPGHVVDVSIDDETPCLSIVSSNKNYVVNSTKVFLSEGSHTIKFLGRDTFVGDQATIIDEVSLSMPAVTSISDVKAEPIDPWGKVALKFKVDGVLPSNIDDYGLVVTARDQNTGEIYNLSELTGNTKLTEGEHVVVCDLAAQGIFTFNAKLRFVVKYEYRGLYCVIDLTNGSGASSFPVTFLDKIPSSGWTDIYKTSKLVLRRVSPGSFLMQGSQMTTLTKSFYIGVFEVTQKQWALIVGAWPRVATSYGEGDLYPVYYTSYRSLRGSVAGGDWPHSSRVDSGSVIGRLRAKTGLNFDLPTEAQWEYACRAGTETSYYWGEVVVDRYCWASSTSSHPVGTKLPNAWGLYDMNGNVSEWCLDYYSSKLLGGTDPKGSEEIGNRVVRGGNWSQDLSQCSSSYRVSRHPSTSGYGGDDKIGFRVGLLIP